MRNRDLPMLPDAYSSQARVASILNHALAGRTCPRILDVGCGDGAVKRAAIRHGLPIADRAEWMGLDVDRVALERAVQVGMQVRAADVFACDPRSLPGPFDAVVFADVLEHLAAPETVLRRVLPRLCTRESCVVASLPNVANVYVRLSLCVGRFHYRDWGLLDRGHLRFYTRQTARRMLEAVGLEVGRAWVTPLPLYLLLWDGWLGERAVAAWVQRALFLLTRMAPSLLGYQFVFEARYRCPVGGEP